MNKPFFIMIYTQDGESALPMTDGYDPKFFATEEEAREAGNKQGMAQAFGFEIFDMGEGR